MQTSGESRLGRLGIMGPIMTMEALVVGDLLVLRMAIHAGIVTSVDRIMRIAGSVR